MSLVRGLLTNVVYKNLKQEDGIAQFVIEVEQIAFLGGSSNDAADAVIIPNKLDGERPFLISNIQSLLNRTLMQLLQAPLAQKGLAGFNVRQQALQSHPLLLLCQ